MAAALSAAHVAFARGLRVYGDRWELAFAVVLGIAQLALAAVGVAVFRGAQPASAVATATIAVDGAVVVQLLALVAVEASRRLRRRKAGRAGHGDGAEDGAGADSALEVPMLAAPAATPATTAASSPADRRHGAFSSAEHTTPSTAAAPPVGRQLNPLSVPPQS